jgi:hypothetical protein
MTLEGNFKELASKWERLVEELEHGLLWSVTETKPNEEHALATHYIDTATDLVAAAREGLTISQNAASTDLSLSQAGKTLLRCQEQFHSIAAMFESKMGSYGRIRKIKRFGSERRMAWREWASRVCESVERCRRPIDELNRALFLCWQEVADRLGISSVSVHSSSVGQKITVHKSARTSSP